MARTPEHWDDYGSLAALIRGECCNYDASRKRCRMLGRECEVLAPTRQDCAWRSPMSRHPHRVPVPGPFTITNRRQLSKALRAVEKAEELHEHSGHGKCSWCDKALLPVLPGHILDEYERLKGDDDGRDERDLGRDDGDRPEPPPRRLPR